MTRWYVALVIAACIFAASLGWLCGQIEPNPGSNAATRKQALQACLDEADAHTAGAETYAEYESLVADAALTRRDCYEAFATDEATPQEGGSAHHNGSHTVRLNRDTAEPLEDMADASPSCDQERED